MLWSITAGRLVAYPAAGTDAVECLQSTGQRFTVAGPQGTIVVEVERTNPSGGYAVQTSTPTDGRVAVMTADPTGTSVAAGTTAGSVLLLDPAHRRLSLPALQPATAFAFDDSDNLVYVPYVTSPGESSAVVTVKPPADASASDPDHGYVEVRTLRSPSLFALEWRGKISNTTPPPAAPSHT